MNIAARKKCYIIITAALLAAVSFVLSCIVKAALIHFAESLSYPVILGITTIVSMLVPVLMYKYSGIFKGMKKQLPYKKINRRISVLWVLFGASACTGINFIISLIKSSFFPSSPSSPAQNSTTITDFILLIICAGILPAVMEELLFRNSILPCLSELGSIFSVVISALLFALVHSGISNVIFAFLAGIILGAAKVNTGKISCSIAIHMINNLTALFVTAAGTFISPEFKLTLFYISGITALMLSIPLFLAVKSSICWEYCSTSGNK